MHVKSIKLTGRKYPDGWTGQYQHNYPLLFHQIVARLFPLKGVRILGVIVFEVANDLVKAKIGYNGDFFTNDGSVSDLSSDIRTKKNITDLEDGLNMLNKLRPVSFEYNGKDDFHEDDGRIYKGFIADEVKEVAPFYMDEGKGTIDDVKVDDFKTISKSRMIPMMIKSIQELSQQVKEQAKRIKELEN